MKDADVYASQDRIMLIKLVENEQLGIKKQ